MAIAWRKVVIVAAALALIAGLLGLRALTTPDPPRAGKWWFPRGGPYLVGFDSPRGRAELWIDGVRVAMGRGRTMAHAFAHERGQPARRLLYAPGAHEFRFDAPPGARLLWHPPGRRGAPEYVPASSLSTSGAFTLPGRSLGDGLIALGILATIAAAGWLLARPLVDRRVWGAVAGVFAFALLVRLIGLDAAGQTWDEDEYWSSGRNYLVNLLSLDFSRASWDWNFQHPPVSKYLVGLGALFTDGYTGARVVMALLGAGTCALAVAIGRRLFGLRAGIAAGLVCALTPHLVGHARIGGHETPSVFLWTLAVWLALRVQDGVNARRLVWVGVALGLAAGARFTNLLVAPVLGVALLMAAPREQRLRVTLRITVMGALIVPATAAATFYAIWPRMWAHPVDHLRAAYEVLRIPHLPEPYLGTVTSSPAWHYFPMYAIATTPLFVLALALGGAARGAWKRDRAWLVVGAWLVLPFGVAFSPVRQDGVRYILPFFVPLAVGAGVAVDKLISVSRRRHADRLVFAVLAVYLAVACARVYPYYIDYFAEHVGGAAHVQKKKWFEVGWWGEGVGRAVAHVNAHAPDGATVGRFVEPTHVTWFKHGLWDGLTEDPRVPVDWLVTNDMYANARRPGWRVPPGYALAFEEKAQGASLVRVYRREAGSTAPASKP